MEKVEKRSLNQLTPQQIAELEEILDRCSKCAIEEFSEEDTGCWSDFELDEQTVDRLEECFEKSGLFLKQSVDIADAFVHSVFPFTLGNGEEHLSVLYPVLFYALILKNETNLNAIDKRLQRKSKYWGNTKRPFEITSM